MNNDDVFPVVDRQADFCVVGGGIAGLVMALSCARKGWQVVLMHDRPVLGGNASSECRVQISGADFLNKNRNLRETGILEEMRLENCRRNPHASYSVWDMVLYDLAMNERNLHLLLNCSCLDAKMDDDRIVEVVGWQSTTQTRHRIAAKLFADCSGDGVLAPLTGALCRVGREARHEFNESIAPLEADRHTMGMSCIFQTRRYDTPQEFVKPVWAYSYPDDAMLPYGEEGHRNLNEGYWWVELGGLDDSIADTEKLRNELLKILMGVWDHIKNHGDHGAANLSLDWIQFLPSKRESRRYVGDHIMTQNDIEAGGRFPDVIAYGGWPMDNHHPAGFYAVNLNEPATIFHPAPSPYGIGYRTLYSKNIRNLFVGGRCGSATHAALSSLRLIGTCAVKAQAAGTAAAMALRHNLSPAGVGSRIGELQQELLLDDCFLPGVDMTFTELELTARLTASGGTPQAVFDGHTRPEGDDMHQWECGSGDWLCLEFPAARSIHRMTVIFNSGLDRYIALVPANPGCTVPPEPLIRSYRVEVKKNGDWLSLITVFDNHQRLNRIDVGDEIQGIRLRIDRTWGAPSGGIHALKLS